MDMYKIFLFLFFSLFFLNISAQNCWEYEEYDNWPDREGGSIIISEIYYDTRYSEEIDTQFHHLGEYIELFNSSTEEIDLSNWKIKDHHTSFIFPLETFIAPGEILIIAYGGREGYAYPSKDKFTELFPDATGFEDQLIMQNNFVLYNTLANIELFNQNGFLIDRVTYGNSDQNGNCDKNFCGVLTNGEGGVFNGAISEFFKEAIYLENQENYYDHEDLLDPYAIANASPFSIPFSITLQEPSDVINAFPPPPPSSIANFNPSQNYIYSETFNVFEEKMTKSGSYFNSLGKPTITYSWDKETNRVWGTQTLYDSQGRPALNSWSAPSCDGFVTNPDFLRGSFTTYVQNNSYNSLSPISVLNNDFSSLKRYYSNENSNELYQATTDRPYTRTVYDVNNPGNVVKTLSGTNQINGEWKNGFKYTLSAAQELYYAYGQDYFDENIDGWCLSQGIEELIPNDPNTKTITSRAEKTILIDPEGNESIVFTDLEGKTLATAKSGGNTKYEVVSLIGNQGYIDVHIPKGIVNSDIQFLNGSGGYSIIDLLTGNSITPSIMTGGNIYRITFINIPDILSTVLNINSSGQIETTSQARGIKYKVNYYDYSLNYYDLAGNLKKTVQPLGFDSTAFNLTIGTPNHSFISNYTYNASGELLNGNSPDEGGANFIYRNDGQIRFSRNTQQFYEGKFSYTNYDNNGRPIESGVSDSEIPFFDIINTPTVTLNGEQDLSINNNVISKTGVTSWNNSGFSSVENTGSGNFTISFEFPKDNEGLVGISQTDIDGSYLTVEYGMYFINNQISILNNGSSLARYITYYDVGDIFSIERISNTLLFKKNGDNIYKIESKPLGPLPTFVLDGAIYTQGASVSNIQFNELSGTANQPPPPSDEWEVDPNTCTEQMFTVYDVNDNDGLEDIIVEWGVPSAIRTQHFVAGNVSKTYTQHPETNTTWYSYDIYGRVEWLVQYVPGLGVKTIDYDYNENGQVSKVLYQKDDPTDKFVHRYNYDQVGKLTSVETSWDNINFIEHAKYQYYKSGELKRTELAEGLQGIDYVYTLDGRLKAINHPGLSNYDDPGKDLDDAFGYIIDYYNGDYVRDNTNINSSVSGEDNFNGNIKGVRWATQDLTTPNTQNAYFYSYNNNNFLTTATFGSISDTGVFSPNSNNDYRVSNISYDANGNIQSLNRNKYTDGSSNLMDELEYHYKPGKNQLDHVADLSGNLGEDGDIKNQIGNNYNYDNIGRIANNGQDQLSYDHYTSGLVRSVKNINDIGYTKEVSFKYNDRGQRSEKTYTTGVEIQSQTFYVRDASGQVMAIYNDNGSGEASRNFNIEYPIYGLSRLGIADQSNSYKYQLSDHLGNVRAVIQRNGNVDPVLLEDFSSGTPPSPPLWNHSSNTILTVPNERLKVEYTEISDQNYVTVQFNAVANYTYRISFDIDLDETYNYLQYSLQNLIQFGENEIEEIVTENGTYTFNYTPTQAGPTALRFTSIPSGIVDAPANNYYFDNISIIDVTTSNTPIMIAYKDYYPFGMPMPNRNVEGEYRYAFQGQEKDPETGMEAFELRLWDGRIGRWLTTDPAGQYSSPYLGMGNNPISRIDPDGGTDASPDDWVFNPDTNSYYWDPDVTSPTDIDLQAGHQYIGVAQTDVINHFNNNNNWFITTFRNPDVDVPSFRKYLASELSCRVENFITTKTPQRIDDIRGFYENFNYFGNGINSGRFRFNLNMNINGTKVNNSYGEVKIFKNRKLNILNNLDFDKQTYNGKLRPISYPYQIQIYSSRIGRNNPQPTIHLFIHRNQSDVYNALGDAWYGN